MRVNLLGFLFVQLFFNPGIHGSTGTGEDFKKLEAKSAKMLPNEGVLKSLAKVTPPEKYSDLGALIENGRGFNRPTTSNWLERVQKGLRL